MHLLCMCSMLVPSEFSHLQKQFAKKWHFCTFPGISCISESAKNFGEALRQCTFSFDNRHFLILAWVIAQEAPRRWNGLPVVHICWRTLGALLFQDFPDIPPPVQAAATAFSPFEHHCHHKHYRQEKLSVNYLRPNGIADRKIGYW